MEASAESLALNAELKRRLAEKQGVLQKNEGDKTSETNTIASPESLALNAELKKKLAEKQGKVEPGLLSQIGSALDTGHKFIKRRKDLAAGAIGSTLVGGIPELAALPWNAYRLSQGKEWKSPIAAVRKMMPEEMQPKSTAENYEDLAYSLLTPSGWGKAAQIAGKAAQKVGEIAPWLAKTASKAAEKTSQTLPRTTKVTKAIGRGIADESPQALIKQLVPGLASHVAVEGGADPLSALGIGQGAGITLNSLINKGRKIPSYLSRSAQNYALKDPEIQREIIQKQGSKVFGDREVTPAQFGKEVQDVVGNYSSNNQKKFREEYGPIKEGLTKTEDISLEKVIDDYAKPLHQQRTSLEKNNFLGSIEGKNLLRLLNVKPSTSYESLQDQIISKLIQNNKENLKSTTGSMILQSDPVLSKLLSKEKQKEFIKAFDYHQQKISNNNLSSSEKKQSESFFDNFLKNNTEISSVKDPTIVWEMAKESGQLGKYHNLPNFEQSTHMGQAHTLKQDLLHPGLENVGSSQLSKDLKKADKENAFWQNRKKTVEKIIGKKDLTPEQTTDAILSDIGKGSYNLKFVKGVSGEKAEKISESFLHILGGEGQNVDVVRLYEKFKKLPKEDARLFWTGLTPETKSHLTKSFDIMDNLLVKNRKKDKEFNAINWYANKPNLNPKVSFIKNQLKNRITNRYLTSEGIDKLTNKLFEPDRIKMPWHETKSVLRQTPRLLAKQESTRK